uniref:Uncharacterized protein n=1 Tax=Oryza nivara TaxID=4536 RepID=A0A0E0H6N1_ORYNI
MLFLLLRPCAVPVRACACMAWRFLSSAWFARSLARPVSAVQALCSRKVEKRCDACWFSMPWSTCLCSLVYRRDGIPLVHLSHPKRNEVERLSREEVVAIGDSGAGWGRRPARQEEGAAAGDVVTGLPPGAPAPPRAIHGTAVNAHLRLHPHGRLVRPPLAPQLRRRRHGRRIAA